MIASVDFCVYPVMNLLLLGQCKARPFKFHRVYFLFIFCFSAPTDHGYRGLWHKFCIILLNLPLRRTCPAGPVNFAYSVQTSWVHGIFEPACAICMVGSYASLSVCPPDWIKKGENNSYLRKYLHSNSHIQLFVYVFCIRHV